ncbi:hypothetical protein P879_09849, partial [Paragonimus westermani]
VGIRTSELEAIFFATFENVRGTVIACQYPANYVSPVQFKEISNAVLPRAELAFRLITVEAFQHYIIGCPQRIEGEQYQRNTLQFNICLVLKPKPCPTVDDMTRWQFWDEQSAGGLRLSIQEAYESLAVKINRYFYTLEVESAYLSGGMEHTDCEDNGLRLLHLDSIFDQLRNDGTCVLDIENCGSLYLRFSPLQLGSACNRLLLDVNELTADNTSPVHSCESGKALIKSHSSTPWVSAQTSVQPDWEINDDCVFVLTAPLLSADHGIVRWEAIDCISRRLLNHIDGLHSLPELAELAKVDLTVARLCLAHLVRSGVVRALPYPDFLSPVPRHLEATSISITMPGWLGLPRLASLLTDRALGMACLDAVNCPMGTPDTVSTVRCTLTDVFRVYTILCGSPNFSLPHLISAIPSLHFVDVNFGNPPPPLFTSTDLPLSGSNERAEVSLLRLVQFGEINGLIHRLKCYPICTDGHGKDSAFHVVQPNSVDRLPTDFSTVRLTKQQQPVHATVSPAPSSLAKSRNASWSVIDEQLWAKTRSSLLDGLHSVTEIGCRIACESGHVSETNRYISDLFERLYSTDASHKSGQSIIAPKAPNSHQYCAVSTANSAFTPVESRTLSAPQATRSAGDQTFHRFSSISKTDTPRVAEGVYYISEESASPQKFSSDLSEINDSVTPSFYFLWR